MAVSRVLVGSVGVAMLLVGLVAYMGSSTSTVETQDLDAAPLFYHGSNGNGDTTAADIADIAKIGALFKELKGRTDIYLENQTLIAYTKQAIKNKKLAAALEKAFPDSIPAKDWEKIENAEDEAEPEAAGKGKA